MSDRWLLTDAEDERLQGLTVDAQVIYMRVFRRYINFDTGWVDVTFGLMKRAIEYIPDQGSHIRARRVADIDNNYIRARLTELERAGLIEKGPKSSRFDTPAFRCLRATLGKIRLENEPQVNHKDGTTGGTTSAPQVTARVSEEGATSGTPNEPQGVNHKTPGIREEVLNNPSTNITDGTTEKRTRPRVDGREPSPAALLAKTVRPLGVTVMSSHPTVIAWAEEGFTAEQLIEAVEIARQAKPPPQPIPANYLDSILRNQRNAQKARNGHGGCHEASSNRRKSGAELLDEATAGAFANRGAAPR